jgi:hypothetical protein
LFIALFEVDEYLRLLVEDVSFVFLPDVFLAALFTIELVVFVLVREFFLTFVVLAALFTVELLPIALFILFVLFAPEYLALFVFEPAVKVLPFLDFADLADLSDFVALFIIVRAIIFPLFD